MVADFVAMWHEFVAVAMTFGCGFWVSLTDIEAVWPEIVLLLRLSTTAC